MTEKEKDLKLQEVNQILKDNGIDIKFSADWGTGYCEIKYHGEVIHSAERADGFMKLGENPDTSMW